MTSSSRSSPDRELHPHEGLLLPQPELAPGFLACALLFLSYELGLAWQGSDGGRNLAELFVARPLLVLGDQARYVRWTLLVAATAFFYVRFRRTHTDLRRSLLRSVGEGCLAGMLLGPFLMVLLGVFDAWPGGLEVEPRPSAPPLAVTLRLFGSAAWEELVFRLGCHSILFLILTRVVAFFGVSRPLALVVGDIGGLLGSSVIFACFHLAALRGWARAGGALPGLPVAAGRGTLAGGAVSLAGPGRGRLGPRTVQPRPDPGRGPGGVPLREAAMAR